MALIKGVSFKFLISQSTGVNFLIIGGRKKKPISPPFK